MTNKRRTLALIMAAMLTAASLAACGGESSSTAADTTAASAGNAETDAATEAETTDVSSAADNLPALDFDGVTVNINCRGDEDTITEIYVESENGEVVNDAIYRRNVSVEERLNVKLNCIPYDGWANYAQTIKKIRSMVQAGEDTIDLIAGWSAQIPSLAAEGLFVDLNTVNYIDKAQPWWNRDMVNNLQVNNKLFFLTGDIAITELSSMYVFFYNKSIGADFGVSDLYQNVFDHTWTLDKLREVVAPVYSDVNGNNQQDKEDIYGVGISYGSNVCDGFIEASDFNFYSRTSDGGYELNTSYSMIIDLCSRLYDFYFNSPGVYAPHAYSPESGEMEAAFRDNKLMLYTEWLGTIQDAGYNEMQADFGILPYPLMTEDQQNYRTFVQNAVAIWCIPITAKSTDVCGAVMEAMAAENYRTVIPAYFETAMKVKYSRDNESSQILDILRDGAHLDFGIIYNESLGSPYYCFRDVLGKKSSDMASYLAKNEGNYKSKLEAVLASFE